MAHYREMLSQNNSCMQTLAMNVTGTQSQQHCLFCHPPAEINAWLRLAQPLFCYLHFICYEIPNSPFTVFVYLLRARAHTGGLLCRVFPSRSEPAPLHQRDGKKKSHCT